MKCFKCKVEMPDGSWICRLCGKNHTRDIRLMFAVAGFAGGWAIGTNIVGYANGFFVGLGAAIVLPLVNELGRIGKD
jgi:hypothetical protein